MPAYMTDPYLCKCVLFKKGQVSDEKEAGTQSKGAFMLYGTPDGGRCDGRSTGKGEGSICSEQNCIVRVQHIDSQYIGFFEIFNRC